MREATVGRFRVIFRELLSSSTKCCRCRYASVFVISRLWHVSFGLDARWGGGYRHTR